MSIIVNRLFKNTAIVLAVFAFFAFVVPQAAFATQPTVTFDSPTKKTSVNFTISNLTPNSNYTITASATGETDVTGSKFIGDPAPSSAIITLPLTPGTWSIVGTSSNSTDATTSQNIVISGVIETLLEVDIYESDDTTEISQDAASGAKVKPGDIVYVTYRVDGPKVETSNNDLYAFENLISIFYYDKNQLTFEEYQRADGTDNALSTILPKNTGGTSDDFQKTLVSRGITYDHYSYLLPKNVSDPTIAVDAAVAKDAYFDDTEILLGKHDYLFYGPAYILDDSLSPTENICEGQYAFIDAADFPTLIDSSTTTGTEADFANFDCVGYRGTKGQFGTVSGTPFPGTGEAFSGDDAAVLGRIKFTVPSVSSGAVEKEFPIITTAVYRSSYAGITAPVEEKENVFTLTLDDTAPTVTETALVDSAGSKSSEFGVKVTFDETVGKSSSVNKRILTFTNVFGWTKRVI